jgi:cyclopropane fatty-acyl-phospholipid synthase-like methyltransferase
MTFDYDFIPSGYYDFRETGLRYRWHHKKFLTVEFYAMKTKPDLIIDLGCGPGVFLRNYCKSIENKIGFDISRKQVKYANAFSTKTLSFHDSLESLIQRIYSTPFTGDFSVCITAIELIEHLSREDMHIMIKTLNESLRSKGATKISLVFTTPNKRSLWPLVERLIDFFLKTNYREQHIAIMNYGQFQEVTEQVCGKKATELFSYMSFPQWIFLDPPCSPIKRFMLRGMLMLAYVEKLY